MALKRTMPEQTQPDQSQVGAASGASAPISKFLLLAIPEQEPQRPTMRDEFRIMIAGAPAPHQHMQLLVPSVLHRLSLFLHQQEGVKLGAPLFTLQTPEIDGAASGAAVHLTPYKERWNMEHCAQCLQCTTVYEAAMTIYQFSIQIEEWDGQQLGVDLVT
jgi:hypothetical protein